MQVLKTGLMQVDCRYFLSTSFMEVASTICSTRQILILTDLMKLPEANRRSAFFWESCMKPVKSTTSIKSGALLAVYATKTKKFKYILKGTPTPLSENALSLSIYISCCHGVFSTGKIDGAQQNGPILYFFPIILPLCNLWCDLHFIMLCECYTYPYISSRPC